ncbi:CaiB/BaiF CoA transferase family protein [Pseudomonas xantholysinigenes]|uniref:CoA transferase n=1 Tax=Pseudomonas xantholysinigenes TaxID=2745490 RepID=A0A9E6PTG3_9PSED|nr:CoA transferase [Pseudomonas xantholysinigenes]QXI36423.1 CoA transferase [Pseudomonas xantholysinigenes]
MKPALEGLLIIDLTRVLAGPFCTMLLADHGARVIKVEQPGKGDDARAYGPWFGEKSAYFSSLNRGKESIALDLKQPEDRAIFEQLLEQADVLTENFRPGTMEKLGYGWDTLHARYPRLIYGAASGFGHTGSSSQRRAYDMIVQGMGGIMSVTGEPGRSPVRVGVSIGDISAGLFLTCGLLMALLKRQQSGLGAKVDIAMFDCQLALMEYFIGRYFATGEVTGPVGSYRPAIAPPFGVYQAQDGGLVIAAGNDKLFALLCQAIGRPEMAEDPLFANGEARKDNEALLARRLDDALAAHSVSHWTEHFAAVGLPAGPINRVDQAVAHPQVAERNMLIDVDDPQVGRYRLVGSPIKISDAPDPRQRRAAPALDQDRAAILKALSPSRREVQA